MEAEEQKGEFPAHLMKITYRPRRSSKSLKKPKKDPELLPLIRFWILTELERRPGRLFAVEKVVARGDIKIRHHPACLEMLRGFDFDSTPNNERIIVVQTIITTSGWFCRRNAEIVAVHCGSELLCVWRLWRFTSPFGW